MAGVRDEGLKLRINSKHDTFATINTIVYATQHTFQMTEEKNKWNPFVLQKKI